MDKEFLYTDGKYSSHSGWHIYNSELFEYNDENLKIYNDAKAKRKALFMMRDVNTGG